MAKNLEKLKDSIPCSDVHFNWLAQTDQDQNEAKKDCLERCGLFDTESSETIGICQEHYATMYLRFAAFMSNKTCNYHLHDSSQQTRRTRGKPMEGTSIPLQKSIELLKYCDKLVPKDAFVCSNCVDLINAEIADGKQRHQRAPSPNPNVPGQSPGQSGSQGGQQSSQGFDQYRSSQNILDSSSSSSEDEQADDPILNVEQIFIYLSRDETINLVGQISESYQFISDYSQRGIPEGSALGTLVLFFF